MILFYYSVITLLIMFQSASMMYNWKLRPLLAKQFPDNKFINFDGENGYESPMIKSTRFTNDIYTLFYFGIMVVFMHIFATVGIPAVPSYLLLVSSIVLGSMWGILISCVLYVIGTDRNKTKIIN